MRTALLLLVAACGATSSPLASLTPTPIERVSARAEIAVVSVGGITVVFDAAGATVLDDGATVGHIGAPTQQGRALHWTAANVIVGPDGERWIVGLAGEALWRVTSDAQVEHVTQRLGLQGARVLAFDSAGSATIYGLSNGFSSTRDGVHLVHVPGRAAADVAAARDRFAIRRADKIDLVDFSASSHAVVRIADASSMAFIDATTEQAHLLVGTDAGVYLEVQGALRRIAGTAPTQLGAAGPRGWFVADGRVSVVERGSLSRVVGVPSGARVFGAPEGDLWITGSGAPVTTRFEFATSRHDAWTARIRPITMARCRPCHESGGSGGLDLTASTTWRRHEERLRSVLEGGTMPPRGHLLPDSERAELLRWLASADSADPAGNAAD